MSDSKNDYFEEFLRNEILHMDTDKLNGKEVKKEDGGQKEEAGEKEDSIRRKPVLNETIDTRKKEAMLSRVADVLGDITSPESSESPVSATTAQTSTEQASVAMASSPAADTKTYKGDSGKADKNESKDEEQHEEYGSTDLDPRILRAIDEMGYKYMTPIQEAAIPVFLTGCDVIGQAQTGTGKTAAFGLPLLQKVDTEKKCLQALILCPTRELAMQAAEELHKFAKYMHGVKILAVYGGQDIGRQIRNLHDGVQIVVGTPGRVMDHIRRNTMKMETVHTVVLDEADEMLDMGFRDDIETILKTVEEPRQVALFSATMPAPILEITKKYQHDAKFIKMTPKEITIDTVEQSYYRVQRGQKREVLCRLMDYYDPQKALIFCNTKHMADDLNKELKAKGYDVDALHGDLSQNQRDNVMNAFRCGTVKVLLATDVAARGIDVSGVDDVFNYDVPDDLDYYVHRIGRTGRAGKKGRSITLVCGRDYGKIREIERMFHTTVKEMQVPSADEISAHKAAKILGRVEDIVKNGNIDKMIPYLEKQAAESGLTMEQYAAAFLRQEMGDDLKEIVFESRRDDRSGRGSYGDRDGRGRRGGRDGRSSYGSHDGHSSHGGRGYRSSDNEGGRRRRSSDDEDEGRRRRYSDDEDEGRRRRSSDDEEGGRRRRYSDKTTGDKKRGPAGSSYSERSGHERSERGRGRSASTGRHPEDRERGSWNLGSQDAPERKFSHDHAGAPKTRKKDARSTSKSQKSSEEKQYEPKNVRDVGLNGKPAAPHKHGGYAGGNGARGGKGRGSKGGRGGHGGDEPDFRLGRLTGLQIKTK